MPSLTPSGNDTNASNDTFTSIFRNPSTYNSLWLYSLILSIDCALKALLLQRWANKPTGITSLRYSLPEQARMSAYFSRRIERANRTVRKLHFLILTSLMVFFLDLLFYLFFVSLSIFGISLSSIIFCSSLLFTTKKFLHSGSPHCTPFTQEKTQKQGPRFDDDVLKRILNMPISDDDLEQFMEAIPGFCASKIVDNPRRSLDVLGLPGLAEALIEFCNCTLSSNRISESVKARRLTTCLRVIEAADLSIAVPHILHLLSGNLSEVSRLVEIGRFLRPLRNGNVASLARGIIGIIISNAERNGRWFTLAIDELGVSEDVLHHYLAHGDSVLLANMIHITRHILHSLQPHPDLTQKSSSILSSLSKFDILNVLPELQRDFCDLWNEVVQQARSNEGDDNPFIDILVQIRHLYDILHGTDIPLRHFGYSTIGHDDLFHQPPPYPFLIPLCMPDHHPEPSAHTHEPCGSTTGGASQTITTTSDILSESSPGDVLDVSHNSTTTGMGISQGIADTSIPSMAESTTQSDNLPEGIIVSSMVFDSPVNRSDCIDRNLHPLR